MPERGFMRVERAYSAIFKAIVILALMVAVGLAAVVVMRDLPAYFERPQAIAPAQVSPLPTIKVEDFLAFVERRDTSPDEARIAAEADKRLEDQVDEYLERLYSYVAQYQAACGIDPGVRVDYATFIRAMDRGRFVEQLKTHGQPFGDSLDRFEKALLEDPGVISRCRDRQGRSQVFLASVEWHAQQWGLQADEAERFNSSELLRVEQQRANAAERAATAHTRGVIALQMAVFLLLVLWLAVRKSESASPRVKPRRETFDLPEP